MSVDRSPGRPVPPAWEVALGLAIAVLLVIGVALLIARAAGFGEVRDAIAQADSTWFLVCFAAQVVALAAMPPALVAVAVYGLFAFWVPTIPALAALGLLPRAGRKLEHVAALRA